MHPGTTKFAAGVLPYLLSHNAWWKIQRQLIQMIKFIILNENIFAVIKILRISEYNWFFLSHTQLYP
jgi:hypothetical protein